MLEGLSVILRRVSGRERWKGRATKRSLGIGESSGVGQ